MLRKAGLTESQAKGYLALIQHGQPTPVELAERTGGSPTNGYMLCKKLASLSLATKKDGPRAIYSPENPSRLRQICRLREPDPLTINRTRIRLVLTPPLNQAGAIQTLELVFLLVQFIQL